jgi:hypothetical protein
MRPASKLSPAISTAPFGDVEAAILVIVGQRQRAPGSSTTSACRTSRNAADRGAFAIGGAQDQPRGDAAIDKRQRVGAVVLEGGASSSFFSGRATQVWMPKRLEGPCAGLGRALGMGDAAAGDHPVHRAGLDHLVGAEAVAVMEGAA